MATAVIQKKFNLQPYNSLAVAVTAEQFVKIISVIQLQTLLAEKNYSEPIFILGGGSNLLLTQNLTGLVIHNAIAGIELIKESNENFWFKVGAGVNWHELVLYCVEHNYGGIENLALIPGTVGAAAVQNIGAYGVEFKDSSYELEAVNLTTGAIEKFSAADCKFAYRETIFKHQLAGQYMVVSVTLKLTKEPILHISYGGVATILTTMGVKKPTIKDVCNAVITIRQDKLPDPKKLPNGGSFFKNPYVSREELTTLQQKYPNIPFYPAMKDIVKIPAAWLIEQCGWKGKRVGAAGVSKQHSLVLVNYANATGQEILELSQQIQTTVYEKFSINLEPEVIII